MPSNLLGTLYKAMSGLNAFTRSLDNLSNNVANLNTTGYKGNDVFYRELAGSDEYGLTGDDGGQVANGQGVAFGGTTIRFSDGALAVTGNDNDLAVDGNGLFLLRDGNQEFYTRAGNFELDGEGYLVDPATQYRVAKLDDNGRLQDINLRDSLVSQAQASTEVLLRGSLNLAAVEGTVYPAVGAVATDRPSFTVYDANGKNFTVFAKFTKLAGSDWRIDLLDDSGASLTASVVVEFGENGAPTQESLNQLLSLSFVDQVPLADVAPDFIGAATYSIKDTPGELDQFGEIPVELTAGEFVTRALTDQSQQTFASKVTFTLDAQGNLLDAASTEGVLARSGQNPAILVQASVNVAAPAAQTSMITLAGSLPGFDGAVVDGAQNSIYPPLTLNADGVEIQENPLLVTLYDAEGNTHEVTVTLIRVVNGAEQLEYQVLFNRGTAAEFSASSNLVYTLSPDVTDPSTTTWVRQAGVVSALFEVTASTGPTNLIFDIDVDGTATAAGLVVTGDAEPAVTVAQINGKPVGAITDITIDGSGKLLVSYDNGDVLDGPTLAVVSRNITDLRLDLSAVNTTSFVEDNIVVDSVDGRSTGQLIGYSIELDGTIVLNYSNADEIKDGRVALALFSNLAALSRAGDALFTAADVSQRVLGSGQDGAFGSIVQRSIERSNVELSREFAEIIIVQRGFQASSQVLNATNELIEELYSSSRGGR